MGPSLDRLRPPPAPEGAADVWFHERMKGAAAYGLRVVRTICSEQTPYQRIDLFESDMGVTVEEESTKENEADGAPPGS